MLIADVRGFLTCGRRAVAGGFHIERLGRRKTFVSSSGFASSSGLGGASPPKPPESIWDMGKSGGWILASAGNRPCIVGAAGAKKARFVSGRTKP